jgi:hypothetical protein
MTALDLDELIACGQVEADPDVVKRARLKVLEREALAAFLMDIELLIPMARDAAQAAEKAHAKALAGPPPILELARPVKPSHAFTTWPPEPERHEAERVLTPPRPLREIEPLKAAPEPPEPKRVREIKPPKPPRAAPKPKQPKAAPEPKPTRVLLTDEERRERKLALARAGYARRRDALREGTDPDLLRREEERRTRAQGHYARRREAARASNDPEVLRREDERRVRMVEAQRRYRDRQKAAAAQASTEATA